MIEAIKKVLDDWLAGLISSDEAMNQIARIIKG